MPLSDYQKSLLAEVDRGFSLPKKLAAIERDYAWAALYLSQGVQIRAAGLLGISKAEMKRVVKAYGLDAEFGSITLNKHTDTMMSRTGEVLLALRSEPWASRLRDSDWTKVVKLLEGEL